MLRMLCFLLLVPGLVFSAGFVEGREYQVVIGAQVVDSKHPVITEFFSYGCPWCYALEQPLQQWMASKGNELKLERVPVVFKPEWELYAKAYYVANTLALSHQFDPLLFKTIQDENNPLASPDLMIAFFVAHGADKEITKSAFEHSPTIDMKIQNGMSLMAHYQINGVPAFIVNHKYKTDLQMAGGKERLFEVLDYLLRK